jgi:threonine dehydrogenase-like Zn-dependent dehydrogenase
VKGLVYELLDGDGPEVVAECSGAPPTPQFAADLARPGGRVLLMGMQSAPSELDLFTLAQWEIDILPANAHVCHRDLAPALEMLAAGDLADRIIDSRIPLERLVPDGLEPLVAGTADGKIVIDPWA